MQHPLRAIVRGALLGVLALGTPRRGETQVPQPSGVAPISPSTPDTALAPGTRVRLTLIGPPPSERTGRVVLADSAYLIVDTRGRRLTVPWSALQTVERSTPKPRWLGATHWAIGGALLGGVIGGTVGRPGAPQRKEGAARDGAAVGAGLGAVLGWLGARENWDDVELPSRPGEP